MTSNHILFPIFQFWQTTCYKMNDFEPHSFSNFLIFSSQGDNYDGCEGGGVAEDAGGKEEKG